MTHWLAVFTNTILFQIFLIISGYWSCYFIKRIYSVRRYKRREMSCCISGYDKEQFLYNSETEIWKYTLLLLIIACEIISCFFSLAVDSFTRFLTFHNVTNTTVELPYSECASYNKPALYKVNLFFVEIPYLYGVSTVARSAEIFLLAFTIHLMNYLIARIKKIKLMNSPRFFLVTALLCAVFITTGFIESLTILSLIYFLILGIIYIRIFILTSNRFKRALLQRAMECLIQHSSNKSAIGQYKFSKVSIDILCCGYLLIILSEIIISIPEISVTIIFFGNCYFPSNLFPSLSYVLQTEEEIRTFLEVIEYIMWLGYAISYTGIFVIWFPMLCITIYYWIKHISQCFSCNRNIKYRISESNLKHLLVHN